MQADPTPEHGWLKHLAGEWTFRSECAAAPGEEPMRAEGTESVRLLGELWSVSELRGNMPGGGPMTALLTIGYDPAKGAFVGTWVGSPMTTMFVYEGSLDADRRVLTLDTEGPDFANPGKTARYRDIFELVSDDERRMRSEMETGEGWQEIMRSTHWRAR